MKNSSDQPSFSLVIVLLSWNDLEATHAVLEHLTSQMPPRSAVWIVDNSSNNPVVIDQSLSYPIHVIRSESNRGFAGGNNLALQDILKMDVEYILLLNNDVEFEPGDLIRMHQYAKSHPDIDILGPEIQEGSRLYFGGRNPAYYLNTRLTQPGKIDYISGTALMCKADVFRKVGVLDEDFFFSGEIADFCRRSIDLSSKIELVDSLKINHKIDVRSRHRDTLYLYYNLRNRFLYIRKHHKDERIKLNLQWVLRLFRLGLGALGSAQPARARAIWWALIDGLKHNYGNRNGRFI